MNHAHEQRQKLYSLLGKLPPRDQPIRVQLVDQQPWGDTGILEKLVLDLNGIEAAPAYLIRPAQADQPPPVILYTHAHGGQYAIGKEELLTGRGALQNPYYGKALLDQGWASLCIDTWLFGERRGQSELEVFKDMLWHGRVLFGMMVYDNLRAIDYLHSRRDLDAARLGVVGISMGSTLSWWTAALDPRVRVCVDLCCMTDFHALRDTRNLDGHGIYYYVPDLLNHFDTAGINALIAPRPHLSINGNYDRLTPPAGLDRIDAQLKRVYQQAGAPAAWQMARHDCGHLETAAMRAQALQFLREHL